MNWRSVQRERLNLFFSDDRSLCRRFRVEQRNNRGNLHSLRHSSHLERDIKAGGRRNVDLQPRCRGRFGTPAAPASKIVAAGGISVKVYAPVSPDWIFRSAPVA